MTSWLKSLELHGFKTFASRTLFEFPGEITAVVGPNGSGKSNITDAIRWVLGEQSYSLLRARKTEDMIFSGSEQRPRAGMASTTIVLNNESGWLPIDYSDVAITRRAYRDGQNEYLLNGQRVRLKEISELLAQSGLAERTYTIIGQGLVDSALSLKPDERRKFFEEAAGIGLYRSRREETLNRLNTTLRNLERVLDIMSELEPRMQSLEKQARRAMEYEQIRKDLRLLLRDWYGFHWHRLQKEVVYSREVLAVQEEQANLAREKQEVAQQQLSEKRANLQELRTRLNQWHSTSSEMHSQREKISRELAVLDERQRALSAQEQRAKSELLRIEEEQKLQEQRLQNLTQQGNQLQEEVEEARSQLENARKLLRSRQSEREEVEKLLRELRRNLVSAESRQMQLKAHQTELENRFQSLQKNLQTAREQFQRDTQVLNSSREKLEKLRQARSLAEQAQSKAETVINDLRQQTGEVEALRRRALDERSRQESEKSRTSAQLEVLLQAEKSFSGMGEGAKAILQDSRQGKLSGKFSPLSAQLIVAPEFEAAVSAALGDALDSLILSHGTNLDGVLAYLEKGEKGRAFLLPEERSRKSTGSQLVSDPDCLGRAPDLIQFPLEMREPIESLLGQTYVIHDRVAAQRLVASIPENTRLVTLKGEVFLWNGAVIAGTGNRGGTISRPRKKQEFTDIISSIESDLVETKKTISELEKKFSQLKEEEKKAELVLRERVQYTSRSIQDYQQGMLEVDQIRQRHEWQQGQINQHTAQIQKTETEIRQIHQDLQKLEIQVNSGNDAIREKNRELHGLPLEDLQSQVNHWLTRQAVANRAVKDHEARLVEQQLQMTSYQKQRASFESQVSGALNAGKQLENERQSLRAEEGLLTLKIDEIQAIIAPAETALQTAEEEFNRLQTALISNQQAVAVADRHASQAQLEFSRHREELESLRKKIEEDFGLVAFEYSVDISGPTPLPFEGMVEQLPSLTQIPPEIEENINRQKAMLRRIGPINPDVQKEYQAVKERHEFLTQQVADLKKADADLRQVIMELDELMKKEFLKTFKAVAEEFRHMFTRLFGGGSAKLVLTDEDNINQSGIDIEARLPGRREQGLALLSGGERCLTAVALVFSLLKISPTPFCVLDEVDAMLDEANVGRFRDLLQELSSKTQFIIVTHNRNTVQAADVIYGVTMGRDSASQIISLRLDQVTEDLVRPAG